MALTLYNVVDYRLKESKWAKESVSGDIAEMSNLLEQKMCYHERIENAKYYRLVVDIDNLFKYVKKDISQILNDIATYVDVVVESISYTTNHSKEGSYHFVIPTYHMKGENQKVFWAKFRDKYGYGASIDTSIYASGKWFRLPNQLKENKNDTEHVVQNGKLSDFILNYIDESAEYSGVSSHGMIGGVSSHGMKDEIYFMIQNGCFDSRCSSGSHQKYIEIGGLFMSLSKNWKNLWWELTLRGTINKQTEFEEQSQSIKPLGTDKGLVLNILKKYAEEENLQGYIQSIKDYKKHIRQDDTTEESSENFEFPDDDAPIHTVFDIDTFLSFDAEIEMGDIEEEEELPYPEYESPSYTICQGDEKQRQKHKKEHEQKVKQHERDFEQEKRNIDKQNREIRKRNQTKLDAYKTEKEEEKENAIYYKRKEYFELFHAKIVSPHVYLLKGSKKVDFYSHNTFGNLYCNLKGFTAKWIKDPHMKTYEYVDFLPPPRYCPSTTFNLFQGLAGDDVKIDESLVDEKVAIFIKQFWLLCGKDDKGLEYVLNYLAHIIQKTGELPRTSIVFKSKQGTGKNVAWEMFANKLLGERYLLVSSKMDDVLGRFPLINQKLLVILDETNSQTAFSNSDQIKSYITSETLTYEKKGVDGITILNTGRMIFFTNNDNSVKIEESDRRFSVFECADDHRNDKVYFDALIKAYNEDWAFFFHFLKTRDISNFNPTNDRVFTKIYKELQLNSTHNVAKYIVSKHSEWERDDTHILVNQESLFKSNWFYIDYKMWCKDSEVKPFSEMGFVKKFVDICEIKRKKTGNFVSIPLAKIADYVKDFEIETDEIEE